MDLWLWSLCFLPVAGALRILPEVKLEGMLGGSITIECPLPQMHVRLYLCREMAESGGCATVVSNKNFVKEEYKHRVTLKPCPDKNLFLVEVTELTKSDSGVYACGTGMKTDRGKTQLVTLTVYSEYELFWEEEPMPEPPRWLHKFLHMPVPPWLQMPVHDSSFEFIPKVTTPAERTKAPPEIHSSPTTPTPHHLRVSRASSVAAAKSPTFLPSTTASKTSAPEGLLRPQTASYNYHTRLHRQRAFHQDPVPGLEDQGFHILVPTTLALILLALLGLLMKRVIQRRKALSRRVRGVAVRMRALEASQRPPLHRPRASQPPRIQNVYSACPRRARAADAEGQAEVPLPGPRATAPSAAPQVPEALWLHAPSLKTSCEYVSLYYKPAAKAEDTDSDDYVNIPCLTHLSSCPPGPRPWCQ
ncbi:fas apoptotic inhibitory molecule 3 isoform X2 [Ursus americanus]|uniref:Fas apoptotic inhibitory molecule 3 isoform X2 n=1 Tax=Ursus maritimus TaxID=29073 RepID=A0A8M1GCB5_URSMA|nr:fas apoptotic inhibitory molecule 3 isoform X1 [Ursus arctos]XP_040492337.1 fas apoptotic inhibitory molecule 3 isoform X2 [Ursus maritimus]XP_045643708.1 fas apoptotic inhibitory molecule 3 isoform X2 [Ursus americanus]